MKTLQIPINTYVDFTPLRLIVSAAVRYWEDAEINGESHEDGSTIPFKECDLWTPIIDLESGVVLGWPEGTTADIHFKVWDEGEYWLEDISGKRVKWKSEYVPSSLLCHGGYGYGDYIILKISANGAIEKWKMPTLDGGDWTIENAQ